MSKLNALLIKSISKPGKYADGGGLYLHVNDHGSKSWIFRFMLSGRRREMGLGSHSILGLAEARAKAFDCRMLVSKKLDPIDNREAEQRRQELEAKKNITFSECALMFIESQKAAWSCPKHESVWANSFANHAKAILQMKVDEITRDDVLNVLRPIWETKRVTAGRLQNRIERVLGYAKAIGYRKGENPASWRDNLTHILPAKTKGGENHFPAMPYKELPGFYPKLLTQDAVSFKALQFMILTAARTKEVIGAEWREIDFESKSWNIPARRMKMRRDHRVPLSSEAMKLLETLRAEAENEFIFPSRIYGRHVSNMACLSAMRRFGLDYVPHGFRSTFKDWASEKTDYFDDLSEKALAHEESNRTKAAYKRGDLFDKRRPLMEDWAKFCTAYVKNETD